MPSYITSIVLQWSADPLSDTTPTWTTVPNDEIRDLEYWAGIDREGNDPEPGGMVVTLKNKNRRWEPLFGSNTIDTQQRFRLTLNGTQEGVWYTESFSIDYPQGQDFSWVTITCGDGISILALDDLPGLDPPDAETVEDVIAADNPWGAWGLDDPAGTKAVSQVRRVRRGKGKKRRKVRTRRYETVSEATGDAGEAGVYKNTPTLGVSGLIVGESATATLFTAADQEYVEIATAAENFVDRNALTVACWVKPTTTANQTLVAGPNNSAGGTTGPIFQLVIGSSGPSFKASIIAGDTFFEVGSTTAPVAGTIAHVAATYDGSNIRLYVDGVLEDEASASGLLDVQSANILYIGRTTAGSYANAVIGRPSVYEHALTAERVLAHYQAGALRGFPQQTAGERIAAIATSDLWSEASIQTTGRDVVPIMQNGQSRMEEIAEAAHAEGPRTMFFFNGNGDPVYLGFEWQETNANYNTVQWTFTDDGTGKPYNHVQLEYDFETFNEVLASHESGESVLVTDTTESGKRGRRVNSEFTDVLLVEHHDVEALAAGVLDYYKEPAKRPVSLTIDGYHCLAQILDLDIGHLINVTKQGETGAATERVCHIIAKRKTLQMVAGGGLAHCTYTLSRGFDPTGGTWILGYNGYSELGQTTELA